MRNKLFIWAAAITVALILLGEGIAYFSHPGYSISTDKDGNTISYTVHSDIDTPMSEMHLSNGHDTPRTYYLMYDTSYKMTITEDTLIGTTYLLSKELKRCPSITIHTKSVDEIVQMIDSSMSTGNYDIGLMIVSGALPDVMYNGTSGSKVMQWISAGGCISWAGPQFGRFISTHDGLIEVENYDTAVCSDLFGAENIFSCDPGEMTFGYDAVDKELTLNAIISYNHLNYAVNMSKITTGVKYLGYTDGTYASVSILKHGNGMMTLFGGYTTFQNIWPHMHVLMMGMTYETELVSMKSDTLTNGVKSGSFEDTPGLFHCILLSDLKLSKLWVYDRALEKFI